MYRPGSVGFQTPNVHRTVENHAGLRDQTGRIDIPDYKRGLESDHLLTGVDRSPKSTADHNRCGIDRAVRSSAPSDDDATVGLDAPGEVSVDTEQSGNVNIPAEKRAAPDDRVYQ